VSQTPFEYASSLRIGSVDFVSPDRVQILLDLEAPESLALNAGQPRPFPRVNSYLLVPVDDGFLVGQVEWITIEQSPFPKRRGMRDFGLVDLPYPLRRLRLNPLGMLRRHGGEGQTVFRRGAESLPSVGAPVVIPTEDQLRSIIESGDRRRVKIGVSPLANDSEIAVDPDRLFGRHLAVLGNTGSGKSCTVAGLIRWSLEQSGRVRGRRPNARFIILDPNGEYSAAFDAEGAARAKIFKVDPENTELQLRVPLWFWNSAEWCSFTQASARTQRPTLLQALRFCRDGIDEPGDDSGHTMRRFLRTMVTTIRIEQNSGSPWGTFPKPKSFYEKLEKWKTGIEHDISDYSGPRASSLESLIKTLETLCQPRREQYAHYDFVRQEVQNLLRVASTAHSAFGGTITDTVPPDVDAPLPFSGQSLLRNTEATAEMLNVSDYVETLLIRIRSLLADVRMQPIMADATDITLGGWLNEHLGSDRDEDDAISVIDLSLVPTDVVHLIVAVIARMIFEALQRYMKSSGASLPTVLVMEEAHTFVRRYRQDGDHQDTAMICCQVFERIAREGRKFGLGLVLSSQRPSELSPTVLSQCNTFLLHRISNDRDQGLVQRLVPDNLRGLLRELPSLPSQMAVLVGWASELPVLVRMADLPADQQPRSDDPEFWKVWTGEVMRSVDWNAIADDWQRGPKIIDEEDVDPDNEASNSVEKPFNMNNGYDPDAPF